MGEPAITTAAPTTGGTTIGASTGTTGDSWMSGFNDDLKGYVGTKGFKAPGDVVDAYRHLEKLQGVPQERLLKLPEKFYDDKGTMTPEGRQIYEKLGTPKDSKEYDLNRFVPKENGDPKLMEYFTKIFHDAGITKTSAEKIVTAWNELQGQNAVQMKDQAAQKFKDENSSLQKDWGVAFEQNNQLAKEGARRLGHDAKTIDALSQVLGHAATMKLYHQMGTAVGESAFHGGKPVNQNLLEPTTAQSRIQQYKQDRDFMTKVSKGDVEATQTWTRLHEMAYPGHIKP